MAKKVDPLKAKQAKQKKIAIGGCVLLLALLGFQGPKTLKMLEGPQAIPSPTATTPAPTTPATAAPGTVAAAGGTAAGEVPVAAAPELSAVADSDLSPDAEQGQLATFELFASKDPFTQQAEAAPTTPPAAADPAGDGTDASGDKGDKAADGGKAAAESGEATDGGFTTGGTTAAAPTVADATSIAVNGAAEPVAPGASFPKDEPTFVLVKVGKKSVEIGIAGGEYADGGETLTLAFGKSITLQNTADGSRYELELLTIQGQPVPKQK